MPSAFHRLFAETPDPVLLIDPLTASVVDANSAATRFLGFDATQKSQPIDELILAPRQTPLSDLLGMRQSLPAQTGYLCRRGSGAPVEVAVSLVDIGTTTEPLVWMQLRVIPTTPTADVASPHGPLTSLEDLPALAYVLDFQGVLKYANSAFLNRLGFTAEEIVGKSAPFPFWPNDAHPRLDSLQQIILGGKATGNYSVAMQTTDGSRLDTLWRAQMLTGTGSAAEGWLVLVVEITDLKRYESAVRASEQRFRSLCANSAVGIILTERNGDWKWVNNYVRYCLDSFSENLLGDAWFALVHPEDRGRVRAEWQSASLNGRSLQATFRVIARDQSVRWLRFESRPFHGDRNEVVGHTGLIEDVSERRRLAEHQRRLTEIIEATTDIVSLSTLEGRMIYLNQAGRDCMGSG